VNEHYCFILFISGPSLNEQLLKFNKWKMVRFIDTFSLKQDAEVTWGPVSLPRFMEKMYHLRTLEYWVLYSY
jgi:hypothetical protein